MLNRSAIVVKPRQPFLDWLHTADPTSHRLTLRDLALEPTIYLIPECDTEEDVREVLEDTSPAHPPVIDALARFHMVRASGPSSARPCAVGTSLESLPHSRTVVPMRLS
jgi:hypothetical protein